MRKAKLDTKSEKSGDAFFDDENAYENAALSFAGSAKTLKSDNEKGVRDEQHFFINLLKQVFIFLPGTFLLFFMSFGIGIIFMEILVFRRPLAALPDDYPFQFALMGLIIFVGTLMTWLGLGDIKNRKHFAIPASLILSGAALGAIVKAAATLSDLADEMLDDVSYMIYLLPLALVIPILAKSIVDRKTKDV